MGIKEFKKKIKTFFSSITHPSVAVVSSLSVLPLILAEHRNAYYIDAGTLGMIIQGLAGLAIAALATAAIFRRRITDWVKSKFKRFRKSGGEENTESALPTETEDESRR